MRNDIEQTIAQCRPCQQLRPSQPHTTMADHPPSETPTTPMHSVATDLFHAHQTTYLTLVDRASGYLLAKPLRTINTAGVINALTEWFNSIGWPSHIRTDGGPQFRGDFRAFCKDNDIQHELSPAYHPASHFHL